MKPLADQLAGLEPCQCLGRRIRVNALLRGIDNKQGRCGILAYRLERGSNIMFV